MKGIISVSNYFQAYSMIIPLLIVLMISSACEPMIQPPEGYENPATTSPIESTSSITDTGKIDASETVTEANATMNLNDALSGTQWTLTSDTDTDTSRATLNVEVTISFENGQVTGNTGCNRYFGTYQLDGDKLVLGPIGSTRMACAKEIMDHEHALLIALGTAESFKFDGSRLTIAHSEGELVFQR